MIEVILYVGLSSGIAIAMFGMLNILETSRLRVSDASQVASQAAWVMEQMEAHYTGMVAQPTAGASGTILIQENNSRLEVMDGALWYLASSGAQLLTTSDVEVSEFAVAHDGGPASRSLVHVSFVLTPASSSDTAVTSHSYSTTLYAH